MYDGGRDEETAREEKAEAGWHQKTRTPHRDVGKKREKTCPANISATLKKIVVLIFKPSKKHASKIGSLIQHIDFLKNVRTVAYLQDRPK